MTKDLIIPVYLNQRIVFDMLAMLEDGISQVTRVVTSESKQKTDETIYGADIGLNKAISSLLAINFSGKKSNLKATDDQVKKDEERVHTPSSLFFRLREKLTKDGIIKIMEETYEPKEHDLVEFSASMNLNPIIHTMESFISLMEMFTMFNNGGRSSKNHKKNENTELMKTRKQMESFLNKLKEGNTTDIVARDIQKDYKAVIILETEYLNDPTMADLVDGKFKVVGKITKAFTYGKGNISLLRKSALRLMPTETFETIINSFQELSDSQNFNLPTLEWELPGPAFQVIPIAIFA